MLPRQYEVEQKSHLVFVLCKIQFSDHTRCASAALLQPGALSLGRTFLRGLTRVSLPANRRVMADTLLLAFVSLEDPKFPIESVFATDGGPGWRASQKGEQQIRLIFDQALAVRRIQLHFLEPTRDRLQEFTVRWLTADGGPPREIVRQQWNFNPAGSTSELEDYEVNLEGVSALELIVKPDLTNNEALASLAAWRVA